MVIRPPSKRSFSFKRAPNLDLTPIMGLFVALVPFLLSVAIFTKVALIAMPLPKVAQTEDEVQSVEKEKFLLTVHIIDDKSKNQMRDEKGYLVDCTCMKAPRFLPLTMDSKYDTKGLNEIMVDIKKKNLESDSIVIIPGHFIPFENLVITLDATRESLPDLIPEGTPRYKLFPNVILEEVDSKS